MNAALSDGKIPSLDGLRAFSIMLVVVGHLHATRGFPELGLEHILGDYGLLGVRVFFVISGFLITTLLLRELEQQGRISLRAFYARRALRIFPAAFAFIGALALADWLGWIELRPVDLLAALTYTVNFLPECAHTLTRKRIHDRRSAWHALALALVELVHRFPRSAAALASSRAFSIRPFHAALLKAEATGRPQSV